VECDNSPVQFVGVISIPEGPKAVTANSIAIRNLELNLLTYPGGRNSVKRRQTGAGTCEQACRHNPPKAVLESQDINALVR
jgi:hypothetical protein